VTLPNNFFRRRSRRTCDTADDVDRCDVLLPKKKVRLRTRKRFDPDATSTWLAVSAETPSFPAQKPPDSARFVDKLLNIHRSECAELTPDTAADFLSSFDPIQNQGLFNGLRRT